MGKLFRVVAALTNYNPQDSRVTHYCCDDHEGEGQVPEVNQGVHHEVIVHLDRTGNCCLVEFTMIKVRMWKV